MRTTIPRRARRRLRARRCSVRGRRRCPGRSGQAVDWLDQCGRLEYGRAVRDCGGRRLSEAQSEGEGDGRHLRNGRRLRALLPQRDRSLERVAADARLRRRSDVVTRNVKWVAFTVANDGLSVVVNRSNTWASCLTVAELKKIWEPGSKVDNWNQVRDGFPNVPLKLFGAGTDSGTFDYFTEAINGRARASRSDYLATEDDNVVVTGVAGRARRARLLRVLVLRGEQGQAQGPRRRRRQGHGLRHAERRDRAGEQVPAAFAAALHLRKARLVPASGRGRRTSGTSSTTRRRSRSSRASSR